MAPARAAAAAFHLPLAVDASRAVRQRVEACHRNLFLAHFTDAVGTLCQAREGPMNLIQLAGLQFRKLSRDLLTAGVKSAIGAVAGLVGSTSAQIRYLAGQCSAQRGAAGHQGIVQSEQS